MNGEDKEIFDNANSEFNVALKNLKKASDLDPNDYDIFFGSAGHGTLFDYPHAKDLQKLLLLFIIKVVLFLLFVMVLPFLKI